MKLKDSIILIVVVIIAIALGVFVGIKVTERKTDNNNNNQPTQSEMDDKSNDDKSGLEDAIALMNNYKRGISGSYDSYITDLSHESIFPILINATKPNGIAKSEILKKDGFADTGYGRQVILDGYIYDESINNLHDNIYDYDVMQNNLKRLFGSTKTLRKETFVVDSYDYFYSKSLNAYIGVFGQRGSAMNYIYKGEVTSKSIEENNLVITADIKKYDSDTLIETKSYKYTFKSENNNYYLADISEVK